LLYQKQEKRKNSYYYKGEDIMASIRKEVTGMAADLANTYKETPVGGTDMGPGTEAGPVNSNRMLKEARGYYDQGGEVDTRDYGLEKGPMRTSLGERGKSMSGNGEGRFGPQMADIQGSGPNMPNRVK